MRVAGDRKSLVRSAIEIRLERFAATAIQARWRRHVRRWNLNEPVAEREMATPGKGSSWGGRSHFAVSVIEHGQGMRQPVVWPKHDGFQRNGCRPTRSRNDHTDFHFVRPNFLSPALPARRGDNDERKQNGGTRKSEACRKTHRSHPRGCSARIRVR